MFLSSFSLDIGHAWDIWQRDDSLWKHLKHTGMSQIWTLTWSTVFEPLCSWNTAGKTLDLNKSGMGGDYISLGWTHPHRNAFSKPRQQNFKKETESLFPSTWMFFLQRNSWSWLLTYLWQEDLLFYYFCGYQCHITMMHKHIHRYQYAFSPSMKQLTKKDLYITVK